MKKTRGPVVVKTTIQTRIQIVELSCEEKNRGQTEKGVLPERKQKVFALSDINNPK